MAAMLFLGDTITSTQAVSVGLITREVSSRNPKEFEEKVFQIANELVESNKSPEVRSENDWRCGNMYFILIHSSECVW